jgi:hypothetical protein
MIFKDFSSFLNAKLIEKLLLNSQVLSIFRIAHEALIKIFNFMDVFVAITNFLFILYSAFLEVYFFNVNQFVLQNHCTDSENNQIYMNSITN